MGIAGASWRNPLMVLRTAFGLDAIEAIVWATDNGARVISMSFGGYTVTHDQVACEYAFERGVVLVGAAGNDGTSQPFYPAAYSTVLAVTGVTAITGDPVGYNWGNWVDISAPTGVKTTYPGFPRRIDADGTICACFPCDSTVSGHFDRSTRWVTGENKHFLCSSTAS